MASSKDLILENAKQLFAENGFKGTTIAQIAKTSNVTDAAIYRHYKSKQQIFDVIVETFLADYRVLLDQIRERQKSGYCLIENLIHDLCAFIDLRNIEFKVILNAYTTIESARKAMDTFYDYLAETVTACLMRGIKDGTVRSDIAVPQTAVIIATLLVGVNRRRLFGPIAPNHDTLAQDTVVFCQSAIRSF